MKNKISRRNFLKNSLLLTGGLFLAPIVESCRTDDDLLYTPAPSDLSAKNFDFGVASFDPTENSVIIWTRYSNGGEITWEISTDSNFGNLVRQGVLTPNAANDYSVAVEIQNLNSNTKFYYRFYNRANKDTSVVGETITLPSKTDNKNEVKFAVVSCSNFPSGLFNVYDAAAKSDADLILHLGDYIYEYAPGQYGTNSYTNTLGRAHKPAKELITLEDYRERYRQYRGDKKLQFAHQKKPFICVWDDHEIANDSYKSGAENHQANEGSFDARKTAALQAYSEYIPLKTGKDAKIYRSFNFGNILSLHMLDTRVIARDKQLEYSNYFDAQGNFNQNAFKADLFNSGRHIVGYEQISWLQNQMNSSTAKWQVLGQQVLMTKMLVPAELLMLINKIQGEVAVLGSAQPATMAAFQQALSQLVTIKTRKLKGDPTLTAQELARINTVLPYNLDAWDGYPMEREYLYAVCLGKNVISLAGDTHNGWYGKMVDGFGNKVGTELAASSVSSPGLEEYLGISDPVQAAQLAGAFALLIDDLEYGNLTKRGYLYAKFSTANVNAEWRYVDTVFSETYSVTTEKTVTI